MKVSLSLCYQPGLVSKMGTVIASKSGGLVLEDADKMLIKVISYCSEIFQYYALLGWKLSRYGMYAICVHTTWPTSLAHNKCTECLSKPSRSSKGLAQSLSTFERANLQYSRMQKQLLIEVETRPSESVISISAP